MDDLAHFKQWTIHIQIYQVKLHFLCFYCIIIFFDKVLEVTFNIKGTIPSDADLWWSLFSSHLLTSDIIKLVSAFLWLFSGNHVCSCWYSDRHVMDDCNQAKDYSPYQNVPHFPPCLPSLPWKLTIVIYQHWATTCISVYPPRTQPAPTTHVISCVR